MNLFGRSKAVDAESRLAHLEAELHKLSTAFRQLETEQITLHDQCRKWMRRAVAAERREPSPSPATGAAILPSHVTTPARLRSYLRKLRDAGVQLDRNLQPMAPHSPAGEEPATTTEEEGNGVHS